MYWIFCSVFFVRGKKVLKEKVVQLYEGFFRGEQVAAGNANFWEEFFLIKPKMAALEAEIGSLQVQFIFHLTFIIFVASTLTRPDPLRGRLWHHCLINLKLILGYSSG
jgi:hypothetical protein